ncbi:MULTISPECIES: hypothetical protein [unclassified Lentimicrobium]|uniref:hypothetical protein n=1 Tax=unclassified Lentimicrobium TaxID=2677434 RepID=UPI001553C623|nr:MULTISPECIES: hypothetical protein [unclassified Lentimicrobium]NPD48125.1 hypothetical protein [Lentimicrobium sp. S6]NPD86936.1 hypothetical protein [Lentimicrobium sp. L6]
MFFKIKRKIITLKAIVTLCLLVCFTGLFAQNSYNDMIFLLDSNDTIKNCRILNINHNKVTFDIVNGKKNKVIAMGVLLNAYYIKLPSPLNNMNVPFDSEPDFIKDDSFDYNQYLFYQSKYLQAIRVQRSTLVLSIIGVTCIGIGEYFLEDYEKNPIDLDPRLFMGSILKYGGIGSASVGIPLFVTSTISKNTYKKNLQSFDKSTIIVGVKLNNNGIGISMYF